jgi:hypothetical protein
MNTRTALAIGVAVIAAIGAAGFGVYLSAPPTCDNRSTLASVNRILRTDYHLEHVFLNDVSTVSGGLFSDSRVCAAELAEIRGNENASALPWREIRYRIANQGKSQPPVITVELGTEVPLAPPQLSFWRRMLAYL